MSKLDACNYILELDNFKNDKSVIELEIRKMNKKIKVTADDILKAISMRDRVLA
jgi:predicted  nucleic acid-binding Zn-ribbon protein